MNTFEDIALQSWSVLLAINIFCYPHPVLAVGRYACSTFGSDISKSIQYFYMVLFLFWRFPQVFFRYIILVDQYYRESVAIRPTEWSYIWSTFINFVNFVVALLYNRSTKLSTRSIGFSTFSTKKWLFSQNHQILRSQRSDRVGECSGALGESEIWCSFDFWRFPNDLESFRCDFQGFSKFPLRFQK